MRFVCYDALKMSIGFAGARAENTTPSMLSRNASLSPPAPHALDGRESENRAKPTKASEARPFRNRRRQTTPTKLIDASPGKSHAKQVRNGALNSNTLRIEILGSPRVLLNGTPVNISRKRVRAILFYLAGENKSVPRTTLAWMLWPDTSPQTASRNLSIHVSYLKKSLGENALEQSQGALSLGKNVQTDIRDYAKLSQDPSLEAPQKTFRLFRGSFLEGFSLKDAQPFDQWSISESEQWQSRSVNAAMELSFLLESEGATNAALALIESSISKNPIHEDLYRRAMRLMDKAGMRGQVGELYSRLTARLNDELGIPPSIQTVECYQAIIGSNDSFTASVKRTGQQKLKDGDMPFLGRTEEMDRAVSAPTKSLLLIRGSAGMGKTRFLREIPKQTNERRLSLSFTKQAKEIPFGALLDAVKAFAAQPEWSTLARRAPHVMGAESWARLRCLAPSLDANPHSVASTFALSSAQIQETVRDLFTLLSMDCVLHVTCDDIQNADSASLEGIRAALMADDARDIKFTATLNPDAATPQTMALLNSLQRNARLETVTLEKLEGARMMEVLLFYFPDIDKETADRLIALADGNPYWMKAIIQGLDSGYTEFSGKASLEKLFEFTLQSLSPQASRAADVLAVCDGPCEGEVFGNLCPEDQADDILAELSGAGLAARDKSGRIALSNARVQEYLVARLRLEPRRFESLNLKIAYAMESLYAEAPASAQDIAICRHLCNSTHPSECGFYAAKAGDYLLQIDDVAAAVKYYKLAVKYLKGSEKLDAAIILYINMTHSGQLYEADLYLHSIIAMAKAQGRNDYALTFEAARKIESIPEYIEVRAGVIPCYASAIDPEICSILLEAEKQALENGASSLLISYILGFQSSWYMIAGNIDEAVSCLNRIVGLNLCQKVESNATSSMSIFFSAIVTLIALMKDKPDPRIYDLIKIEEESFKETPIRSFSSSSEGIKSMCAYIKGDYELGDKIADTAIELFEKSNNEPMLAAMLTTKATMQHSTNPAKAYWANYEAYRIAKRIGANYSLTRSLIGLVITSPNKPEATAYLAELRELAGSIGDAALYNRIANMGAIVKSKPE